MIYGYARVSIVGQKNDGYSLEEQSTRLRENGAVKIYVDAFTETKMDRPEFSKLLEVVKTGDTIMATNLDRVSRSVSPGINLVDELLSRGVSVHILIVSVMNNTPTGKLIRNIMFSFAEFERDMIVERTSESRAIARQQEGYKEGRKEIVPDEDQFEKCHKTQKDGTMTVNEGCKTLGISRSTWYGRIRKAV
jgi:DNA invertase Pin-like site-specific DNA recombinase